MATDLSEEIRVDLGNKVRGFGLDADDPHADVGSFNVPNRRSDGRLQRGRWTSELQEGDPTSHVTFNVPLRRLIQGICKLRSQLRHSREDQRESMGLHGLAANTSPGAQNSLLRDRLIQIQEQ